MGCGAPGCERPAAPGRGMCWAHIKRMAREAEMAAPVRERHADPWQRVWEAAIAASECDTDDDTAFHRAEDRLRKAIHAYVARALASENRRHRRSVPRKRSAA